MEDVDSGYAHFLYRIFNGINGIAIGLASLFATMLIGVYGKISLIQAIVIIFCIIDVLCMTVFLKSSYDLFYIAKNLKRKGVLPKVIEGRLPYTNNQNAKALCILEYSELYSYNVVVTFYYRWDNFEEIIGYGWVINVQEKVIQIEMDEVLNGHEDIVQGITQNDAIVLNKLVVKPFVPKQRFNREKSRQRGKSYVE